MNNVNTLFRKFLRSRPLGEFRYLLLILFVAVPSQVLAFSFVESAPIGSWQIREAIDTNHKGKKTGTTVKTSMVGKEERDGELHYWIEMNITSFKVKKSGKRKSVGKPVVMKSLVPSSVLNSDPENVVNNLRAFGIETIVQSGNEPPMRINAEGGFMANAMSGTNMQIKHNFEELGSESVEVPAGKFMAKKIKGTGTVSMKIVFKQMNVESESTVWLSDDVPFGIVKLEGVTTTNGKVGTQAAQLLEYGKTGAVSAITQTPQDMPTIPKLFGN